MTDGTRVRRRVLVRGFVQGVGYRWSAAREAERLGVAGWVRNRADGSVEAVAEGDEAAVEAFVAWAAHGPRGASVGSVDVREEAPEHLAGFTVEP
ncbi:acylphosphatase [Cellulomonas fimi]|uniref:acylphosphatase n=1 Tax=Cellulomonas fimi (strain ATCC 484 / DSM 20113 / JCM 1341 / CCUG 24087 / LMG 16345 / NBRC 15513 / NCIMB 8980 / NCTC 7547 / NRS-133) TaxID=590998 RepID=F4H4W5_CELFA|nr:acylphosphatase [Cellulomonas fimi]AEE45445.1 acylphosphatase [Cellulomonas fimi ATCC 484]NNH08936.1 acylphosphatase [Cellulomonas fimi]VEH29411.1 Acylphosphatase [Cellulomonas fimi]